MKTLPLLHRDREVASDQPSASNKAFPSSLTKRLVRNIKFNIKLNT